MPIKKLVAVMNYWDGGELLPYSLAQWKKLGVDVIIVYSDFSNYWQYQDNTTFLKQFDAHLIHCEPVKGLQPGDNERMKRNRGLQVARLMGYEYMITCDIDELYESVDVDLTVNHVCRSVVYFKSPTLSIGVDRTLVPFVHRITPELRYQFNTKYPFALNDRRHLQIDPTRTFNIESGVVMSDILCHHYSYVRESIAKKVNNSSARANIRQDVLRQDLIMAKDGYFCKYYERELHTVPNKFGIPEWPGEL